MADDIKTGVVICPCCGKSERVTYSEADGFSLVPTPETLGAELSRLQITIQEKMLEAQQSMSLTNLYRQLYQPDFDYNKYMNRYEWSAYPATNDERG